MKRAKVKFIYDDNRFKKFKAGEIGYIDGYIRGDDISPALVVIKEDGGVVLTWSCEIEILNFNELGE